jgi:hypothetical protein
MYSTPVRAIAVSATQTGLVIGDALVRGKRRERKGDEKEIEKRGKGMGRREGEGEESERCVYAAGHQITACNVQGRLGGKEKRRECSINIEFL